MYPAIASLAFGVLLAATTPSDHPARCGHMVQAAFTASSATRLCLRPLATTVTRRPMRVHHT